MATCVLCKKSFDVSNMGESALTSRAKGAKHLENAEQTKKIKNKNPLMSEFFLVSAGSKSAKTSTPPATSRPTESPLLSFVARDDTLRAEILCQSLFRI